MIRAKVIHKNTSAPYEAALIEAYEWVVEKGGVLIFGDIRCQKRACRVYEKKWGKKRIAEDIEEGRIKTGVARGQQYLLYGPRIATFDCVDGEMKRIEGYLSSEWDDGYFQEIRAFTMTSDTHPRWTDAYKPVVIDRSSDAE